MKDQKIPKKKPNEPCHSAIRSRDELRKFLAGTDTKNLDHRPALIAIGDIGCRIASECTGKIQVLAVGDSFPKADEKIGFPSTKEDMDEIWNFVSRHRLVFVCFGFSCFKEALNITEFIKAKYSINKLPRAILSFALLPPGQNNALGRQMLHHAFRTPIIIDSEKKIPEAANTISLISHLIFSPSLINLDIADIAVIRGTNAIGTICTAEAGGKNKISKILSQLKPLYTQDKNKVYDALLLITCNQGTTLEEITSIGEKTVDKLNYASNTIWGARYYEYFKDKITVNLLLMETNKKPKTKKEYCEDMADLTEMAYELGGRENKAKNIA